MDSSEGKKRKHHYTLLIPFIIVLSTQIVHQVRDLVVFHGRKIYLIKENADSVETLRKSAEQVKALEKIQTDLEKASDTDPTIKRIVDDFFPREKSPISSLH